MKKLVVSFLVLCLIIVFSFSSFAVTPYGGVTENTSQVVILLGVLYNDPSFDFFQDFLVLRVGEYDYYCYFNIDGSSAHYYRYYATSSGYNSTWNLTSGYTSDFSFDQNGYTVVGNISSSLSPASYRSLFYQSILQYCVPFIALIFGFFVFRIRKGGVSL